MQQQHLSRACRPTTEKEMQIQAILFWAWSRGALGMVVLLIIVVSSSLNQFALLLVIESTPVANLTQLLYHERWGSCLGAG
jgi:hypothetical protein